MCSFRHSTVSLVVFDEISRLFATHAFHVTHFVTKFDTVKLIGVFQQFGSESRRYELSFARQLVDHVGYGFSVLGVQRLVDLKQLFFFFR